MKALILNSGIGKRMGKYTESIPKCMVALDERQTILSRQLVLLKKSGIEEVVITTGPFENKIKNYVQSLGLELDITFVQNPLYAETNYIYSIYLARQFLQTDLILMHGDLIFSSEVFHQLLERQESVMVVSSTLPLPKKDFKAVVKGGYIRSVGIDFFEDAYTAQPLYKFEKQDWLEWLKQIEVFCERNIVTCYAEDALNECSLRCHLRFLDIQDQLCGEVDNEEDLIKMRKRLKEETE